MRRQLFALTMTVALSSTIACVPGLTQPAFVNSSGNGSSHANVTFGSFNSPPANLGASGALNIGGNSGVFNSGNISTPNVSSFNSGITGPPNTGTIGILNAGTPFNPVMSIGNFNASNFSAGTAGVFNALNSNISGLVGPGTIGSIVPNMASIASPGVASPVLINSLFATSTTILPTDTISVSRSAKKMQMAMQTRIGTISLTRLKASPHATLDVGQADLLSDRTDSHGL